MSRQRGQDAVSRGQSSRYKRGQPKSASSVVDLLDSLSPRAPSKKKNQRGGYSSLALRNVGDSVGVSVSCVGLHSVRASQVLSRSKMSTGEWTCQNTFVGTE